MKNILLQLDCDSQPSTFDAVVAADSGVDLLFRHGQVTTDNVTGLVHGLIFTRSPKKLRHSAIFIGGSNVQQAEELLSTVRKSFFGPMRVSVLMDANGANTTAAAAVLCCARHVDLSRSRALVLAGTGPVGQRAAMLLAQAGASVRVASRQLEKSQAVVDSMKAKQDFTDIEAVATSNHDELRQALEGVQIVIAAGAAGIRLLPIDVRLAAKQLRVVVDLNAVPPVGIEGIESTATAETQNEQLCYGALGVGGTKMAIHKAAIGKLFERNDLVLDAPEIYEIGQELEKS